MITCPICQKHVLLSHDERDVNANLTEEQTDDFYCPTFVQVCEGRRWSHYWRKTLQGAIPEYCAYIPPFCVTWFADGRLTVEQFEVTITLGGATELIYAELLLKKTDSNLDDFVQAISRFKILVPFS